MAFDRIMRNYNTRSGLSQDWRKPFDRYEVLVNIIYQGENKKTPAVDEIFTGIQERQIIFRVSLNLSGYNQYEI